MKEAVNKPCTGNDRWLEQFCCYITISLGNTTLKKTEIKHGEKLFFYLTFDVSHSAFPLAILSGGKLGLSRSYLAQTYSVISHSSYFSPYTESGLLGH